MRVTGGRALFAIMVLAGCGNSASSGALRVEVQLLSGSRSACVRVDVRTETGTTFSSTPIRVGAKSKLVVGVTRGSMPATVRVTAHGFVDEACSQPNGELSVEEQATFGSPASLVQLSIGPLSMDGGSGGGVGGGAAGGAGGSGGGGGGGLDAGIDLDGDGVSPPLDCDDNDPMVKPGLPEKCTDGKDNDCDLLIDCADPGCAGQACAASATCVGQICVAPTETGLCADGADNDQDGKVDCEDPDCLVGAMCSDSNACTQIDLCGSDGGCLAGAPKDCASPPGGGCYLAVGVCLPDAGGLCSYQPTTGPCSDGDNCTVNDTCDGGGGCGGTRVDCAPPSQCLQFAGTCQADAGCDFFPRTGQPCADGGFTCSDAGVCLGPPTFFGYTPANFAPAQLPASSGALSFGCGTTTLLTASPDGGIGWQSTCPTNPPAPAYALVPVGSQIAVLILADSVFIDAGVVFRAVGDRPLIVAVKNNAVINGTIDVGSSPTTGGAGGNTDCVGGAGTAGSASTAPVTAAGGGGAGFGTDGGDGSDGNGGGIKGIRGGVLGTDTLDPLRGGCRGGNGGRVGMPWGQGGPGGGAVQLSVAGSLLVAATGTITASGSGGRGGQSDQHTGGGGAGSGGAILLEADTLTLTASSAVTANGGAGGEGSGVGPGSPNGSDGADGQKRSTTAATCVSTGACGGNGGSGATRNASAGGAGAPDCGGGSNPAGGGGGGGVGRIRINAAVGCSISGAIVSPQATSTRAGCF